MDKVRELVNLATAQFGELTDADKRFFEAVAKGGTADYRAGNTDIDEPANADKWGGERHLKADRIEWLCTDIEATRLVTHRGICIKGAHIDGLINLAYTNIPFPLYFEKCNIQEQIELHCSRLRELYLGSCHISSLSAYGLKVDGHIFLRDGFEAKGEVNFTGATIEGDFDCSNGHFIYPAGIAINLSRARVRNNILFTNGFKSKGTVVLIDSHIEGNLQCNGGEFIKSDKGETAINASRMRCGGDVSLKIGFRAVGEVSFSGGLVGGNFDCFDGEFCNHSGDALNAEALNVGGGIFLMGNFKGEVRLLGATVGQSLECHGGNFVNPNGYAINADSVNIGRNVFLRNAFKANGEINLIGAKIGGDIDCEKGHFVNPEGIAFHGDQIEVRGSIFLRHGFMAEGIVNLAGGKIKNNLDCEYGQFTNKVGPAILAEGLNVEGSVLLCSRYSDDQTDDNIPKRFMAEGGVSFKRTVIGGDFDCQGSHFINPIGYALVVNGAKINGNVHLCSSQRTNKTEGKTDILYYVFRAEGQVGFDNARIGCTLYCNGGEFVNKVKDPSKDESGSVTLSLGCVEVNDSIIMSDNFYAEGQVNLLGAKIGKQLNCVASQFINPNGIALVAECARVGGNFFLCGRDFKGAETKKIVSEDYLRIEGKILLSGAEIKGCFLWCKVASPEKVSLDLQCAMIGSLWDEQKSWPKKGNLFLHGLEYDGLADESPHDAKSRIDWLSRQGGDKYRPQPYNQLAKVLKNEGHEQDAKRILIKKEKLRTKHLSWISRPFHKLYGFLISYGYRPWRAVLWGVVIVLIGWGVFGYGYRNGVMVPTQTIKSVSKGNSNTEQKKQEECRSFNSFIYSVDTFVPLVDLRQAKYWLVNPKADFELKLTEWYKYTIKWGYYLRWYMWIEIAMGWVITTLLVASITKLSRSE